MRTITIHKNADFSALATEVINITDEEIELVNMPGLRAWLDPQLRWESDQSVALHDRVDGFLFKSWSAQAINYSTAIGGEPTVSFDRSASQGLFIDDADGVHPLSSYTKVLVCRFDVVSGITSGLLSSAGDDCQLKVGPAGQVQAAHSGSTVSTVSSAVDVDTDYIVMQSYDADTGDVKFFVNKIEQEIASGAALGAPELAAGVGVGVVESVGFFADMHVGYCFVFDAAYHKTAYKQYFDRLHELLSAKYSIAF